MRLREKGKTDGDPVHMGWDEAQAALQAGTHEIADTEGSGAGPALGDLPPGSGEIGDDLDAKTRAELITLAEERGLEVSASATKADVIKALRAPK